MTFKTSQDWQVDNKNIECPRPHPDEKPETENGDNTAPKVYKGVSSLTTYKYL